MLVLLLACALTAPCPPELVRVQGRAGPYCIQQTEAQLQGDPGPRDQRGAWPRHLSGAVVVQARPGQRPTNAVSWYQARAACLAAGMHLCTSDEWEDACAGPPGEGRREFVVDASRLWASCYVGRPGGQPLPSGEASACRSPEGVLDLAGNLWEWTDPRQTGPDGAPLIDKRGGGYYTVDPVPCAKAAVGTHEPSFDGTIGFRCCTAARR